MFVYYLLVNWFIIICKGKIILLCGLGKVYENENNNIGIYWIDM